MRKLQIPQQDTGICDELVRTNGGVKHPSRLSVMAQGHAMQYGMRSS